MPTLRELAEQPYIGYRLGLPRQARGLRDLAALPPDWGKAAEIVVGFTPGVGDAMSAYDAYQSGAAALSDLGRGDYRGAAGNAGLAGLAAVGVLPFVPGVTRAVSKGLDMSETARLQRATEQGYSPETWYHGTNADIEAFDSGKLGSMTGSPVGGHSFTRSPELASDFADLAIARKGEGATNVMPARLRMERPGKPHVTDVAIVLDPARIRSVFAKFDPARMKDPDIIAALAGAGLVVATLPGSTQEE